MHANKARGSRRSLRRGYRRGGRSPDIQDRDTLADEKAPILLEKITFPEPVISIAIEPKTKVDQEKMGLALQRLSAEDPTLRVRTDTETARSFCPEWASFISISSRTVCGVSSRLNPTRDCRLYGLSAPWPVPGRFPCTLLRPSLVGFNLELTPHTVRDDIEMKLAHSGQNDLARLGIGTDTQRRVLSR